VDASEPGSMHAAVPLEAVLDQIGRADGAVVAWRMLAVCLEPDVGLVLELVHIDHRDRP
jgi:hypothetical protein